MLISKGVAEGEVITLKLTSGEEIVAKLVEDGPVYYKLKIHKLLVWAQKAQD
jgi:hypothetical protein